VVVCPFCGQGCGLALGIGQDRVLDAKPVHMSPNAGQACVKGRFLVRGALSGPGRIVEAQVRRDGGLRPAAIDEALDRAASGLREAAEGRTALVYPSQVSLEDAFVFLEFGHKVLQAAAVAAEPAPDLDEALEAFAAKHGQTFPAERRLAEIEACGSILAWDIDLREAHPIAWLKVVRAVRRGAGFVAAGAAPTGPVGRAAVTLDLKPGSPVSAARLAEALLDASGAASSGGEGFDGFKKAIPERGPASRRARQPFDESARILASGKPAAILFDAAAVTGPSGPETLAWLWNIALLIGARLFPLARSANERGVHELARTLRRTSSKSRFEEVRAGLEARAFEALYLAGPFPELGDLKPPFLVCQDTHWSRNAEQADVVLPAAAFAEAGGTWVNTEGRVRTYAPALPCPGSARPDGAILAALAGRLGHPEFSGRDAAAVLQEICDRVPALNGCRKTGTDGEQFLAGAAIGRPRFVPVALPAPRRKGRPSAKTAAGPDHRRDALRGFDLVAGNRGYARTRRAR
jgi:predicted molibdopterin-dependent oxidoreductase YjgC